MKVFAYVLMVLFALTSIPLVGILSFILWGVASRQNHNVRLFSATLFRSKVATAIATLVVVMMASLLTFVIMTAEKTPKVPPPVRPSDQAIEFVNLGWENMTSNPPDYALAMSNNLSGVEFHHPEGAANIGLLYENGWGVEKDAKMAALWYQVAISMGTFRSAQADYQLAGLYEKGLWGDRSLSRAKGHYSIALRISSGSDYSSFVNKEQAKLARDALQRLNGQIQ